jgi:hypothetical protein
MGEALIEFDSPGVPVREEPSLPTRRTGQGAHERMSPGDEGKSYMPFWIRDATQTHPNNSASVYNHRSS